MQAIKAVGRSDVILKLEFIKKPVYLLMVVCAIPFGPLAICAANAIYGVAALIINTRHNKKLFGYTLHQQLGDVMGYILLSLVMAVAVYFVGKININIYLLLAIQIAIGMIIYLVGSIVFRVEPLKNLMSNAKKILKSHKRTTHAE